MYFMGLDVGYSNLKVAGGAARNMTIHERLPAGAGPAADLDESLGGNQTSGIDVDVRGQSWVAGVEPSRFASSQREIHSDYTATAMYHALATAGIGFSEKPHIDLLVTGMPVNLQRDKAKRQALKNLLKGRHKTQNDNSVVVNKTLVTVQPVGTLYAAYNEDGDRDLLNNGRIAIVDAGFYSFDWTLIDAKAIKTHTAGTSLSAMSHIVESTDQLILEEYDDSPGPEAIESTLRRKQSSLLFYGKWLDLDPFLNKARSRVATRAMNEMRRAYREERPVDLFILTGGGAEVYREALQKAYPRNTIYVPQNPATANARGFWYLAQERAGA